MSGRVEELEAKVAFLQGALNNLANRLGVRWVPPRGLTEPHVIADAVEALKAQRDELKAELEEARGNGTLPIDEDNAYVSDKDTSSLQALRRWADAFKARGEVLDTGFRCVSEGGSVFHFDPICVVRLFERAEKADARVVELEGRGRQSSIFQPTKAIDHAYGQHTTKLDPDCVVCRGIEERARLQLDAELWKKNHDAAQTVITKQQKALAEVERQLKTLDECGVDGIPVCHTQPGATDANWCHACLLAEYRKAHRERDELAVAWKTRNEAPPPDTTAWNALLAKACAERDAALTRASLVREMAARFIESNLGGADAATLAEGVRRLVITAPEAERWVRESEVTPLVEALRALLDRAYDGPSYAARFDDASHALVVWDAKHGGGR